MTFLFPWPGPNGPVSLPVQAGAIHHASLSPSLHCTPPPGKYSGLKDQFKRKPSWVNYFKSKYCLTLPAAIHSPAPILSPSLPLSDLTLLEFESNHLTVLSECPNLQEKCVSNIDDFCRVFCCSVLYGTASFFLSH